MRVRTTAERQDRSGTEAEPTAKDDSFPELPRQSNHASSEGNFRRHWDSSCPRGRRHSPRLVARISAIESVLTFLTRPCRRAALRR